MKAAKIYFDLITGRMVDTTCSPCAAAAERARAGRGKPKNKPAEPACYGRCCGSNVRDCLDRLDATSLPASAK